MVKSFTGRLYLPKQYYTAMMMLSNGTYLINKRHGSRILELTASWPSHTSYRKVYFNEFVQNYWGCDMGMIIFDLHGGC